MPADANSLWQRFFTSIANLLVRLWPEETKDWGRAFAAELSEIETPLAAVRWLLGGFMLLTREHFKFFLRSLTHPLGVPAPTDAALLSPDSGPTPRLPRFANAIF